MTGITIRDLIGRYRRFYDKERDIRSLKIGGNASVHSKREQVGHLMALLVKAEQHLNHGEFKEATLLLGFVEGWLWANGVFTTEEIENKSWSVSPRQRE